MGSAEKEKTVSYRIHGADFSSLLHRMSTDYNSLGWHQSDPDVFGRQPAEWMGLTLMFHSSVESWHGFSVSFRATLPLSEPDRHERFPLEVTYVLENWS